MKQHITIEQLSELSDKADLKLRRWLQPPRLALGADIPSFMTIGQMIEFLGSLEFSFGYRIRENKWHFHYFPSSPDPKLALLDGIDTYGKELCDALWEAVKEILNKND